MVCLAIPKLVAAAAIILSLVTIFHSFPIALFIGATSVNSYRRDFQDPSLTLFQSFALSVKGYVSPSRRLAGVYAPVRNYVLLTRDASTSEYSVAFTLGGILFSAVIDTGSDLSWVRYNQTLSGSSGVIPCYSKNCTSLTTWKAGSQNCKVRTSRSPCDYYVSYMDGSVSLGLLYHDILNIGSLSLNFLFGNAGMETNSSAKGVLALGTGGSSLINQAFKSINGIFGYCLLSYNSPGNGGKLYVGKAVRNPEVTTRLFIRDYYYVTLTNITMNVSNSEGNGRGSSSTDNDNWSNLERKGVNGNFMVDSGTALSYIPSNLYKSLESEFKNTQFFKKAKKAPPPPGSPFKFCFSGAVASFPGVEMQFAGGGSNRITLTSGNVFAPISTDKDSNHCFGMLEATDGIPPIWGNLAQTNFVIGFDLSNRVLNIQKSSHGCP